MQCKVRSIHRSTLHVVLSVRRIASALFWDAAIKTELLLDCVVAILSRFVGFVIHDTTLH